MLSDSEVTAHTWVLGRMGRHKKGVPGQGITGSGSTGSAGEPLDSSQEPTAANSTGSPISVARLGASPWQGLSAGPQTELGAGADSQQAPKARLHAPGAAVGLRSLLPAAKHQHKASGQQPSTRADVGTVPGHQDGAPALTDSDRAGMGAGQPSKSSPKQGLLNLAETPLAHWTGQAVPAGAAGSTRAGPSQAQAQAQHAGFGMLSQPAAQPGTSSAGAPAAPADGAQWADGRATGAGLAQAQVQGTVPARPCEAAAPGAAAEPPVKLTINIIEGAGASVQLGAPLSDIDPQAGDAAAMFASAQQHAQHLQRSDEDAKRLAALSEVLAKLQPGLEPGKLDLAQLQCLLHSGQAEAATRAANGAAGPEAMLLLPAVPGEALEPEAQRDLDPAARQGLLAQARGWDAQQGSSLMDVVADFSQLTSSVDLLDRLAARSAAQIAAHHAARRERAVIGTDAHGSAGNRPQQGAAVSQQPASTLAQAEAMQADAGAGVADVNAEEAGAATRLATGSQPMTSDISLKQLAMQSAGVRQAAKRSGCAVQQQGQQGAAAATPVYDSAEAAPEGSSASGQVELPCHDEATIGAPGDSVASPAGGQGREGRGAEVAGDGAGSGAAAPAVPPAFGAREAPGLQCHTAEKAAGSSAWDPGLTGSPQASGSAPQGGAEVGTARNSFRFSYKETSWSLSLRRSWCARGGTIRRSRGILRHNLREYRCLGCMIQGREDGSGSVRPSPPQQHGSRSCWLLQAPFTMRKVRGYAAKLRNACNTPADADARGGLRRSAAARLEGHPGSTAAAAGTAGHNHTGRARHQQAATGSGASTGVAGGSQAATSVTSSVAGGPSALVAVTPVSLLERFGSADDLDVAGTAAGGIVLAGHSHSQAAAVRARTEPAPAASKPQRTGLPQPAAARANAGSASPGSSAGSAPGRPDLQVEDSSQQVWHDADSSGSPGQSDGASTPREPRGAGAGPSSLPPAADGMLQAARSDAAAAALEQAAGTAAPPGPGADISAEGPVEAPKAGQLVQVGSGAPPSMQPPQHLLTTASGPGPAGVRLAAAGEQASR